MKLHLYFVNDVLPFGWKQRAKKRYCPQKSKTKILLSLFNSFDYLSLYNQQKMTQKYYLKHIARDK